MTIEQEGVTTNATVTLYHGDCMDILPTLPSADVDAVIADPPYGTTACKWDEVIPFVPMWEQLERVRKERAAIALFASQPFTSALIMSNVKQFKYCWTWDKVTAKGHLVAKIRPLQQTEDIAIFGCGRINFHPQMTIRDIAKKITGPSDRHTEIMGGGKATPYSKITNERFPKTILQFSWSNPRQSVHPTQKPVALLKYLIYTYTNEGDTVLDFTMGSGTTGVACVQTGRNFIGIELDEGYYNIAQKRIAEAQMQPGLIAA